MSSGQATKSSQQGLHGESPGLLALEGLFWVRGVVPAQSVRRPSTLDMEADNNRFSQLAELLVAVLC